MAVQWVHEPRLWEGRMLSFELDQAMVEMSAVYIVSYM